MNFEEQKEAIDKICKENKISKEELTSFLISNIFIGWMKSKKHEMVCNKVWDAEEELPEFVSIANIKKNRGKKNKIIIPNIFQEKKKIDEFMKYRREFITWTCPNCQALIERHPNNTIPCPLCEAPVDYDSKMVLRRFME